MMHRLIRLLVKVFADVFAFISSTAFMKIRGILINRLLLIVGVILLLLPTVICAEEDFCCERTLAFEPVEMPPEQERDISGMLESNFLEGINIYDHRDDCPIKILVKNLLEIDSAPTNPIWKEDLEYVFLSKLRLDTIDYLIPGYWEEGYEGQPNYVQGHAWGNYSIDIRLVNIQFNEKVWEGYTIWNGGPWGQTERLPDETTPNAVEDLGASMSPSIDKLIYDYERSPMNCVVEMDRETVSTGEEITIRLTGLTDDKGRTSRSWQRLVIRLEQGEIINATKHQDENQWVVLVGEGDVILQYKAPRFCQKEKETLTVFNSCCWGGPGRPLPGTPPKKKLTSKTFDIIPSHPVQCRVKPEKEEVGEGQEIDIVLSDFRDALQQPSREFNRIIVHAYEGEIINGDRCEAGPDYRVFRLDEQSITVRYRAPKNGDANSDKITVYNSCEILPLEKSPLRVTRPHEEIATCELRLLHYAWNGTLNLEVTRRFQCNAEEKTSEFGRREVRANDEITQKVNLTIGMDDFDLTKQPAIPGTHLIRDASGEMNGQHNREHFTASRSDKTWCYIQKWISPGSWNTRQETWSGQSDRQIKKENINLLITKDIELNKEAMQDLQKQMQEAAKNNDLAAIQELKGQMVGMVQGNQDNNTIPIRIRIEIVFDITEKDLVKMTWEYKGDDVCLETDDKNESGTNNIELPIALPMAAELKGTYIRGKDGRDTITATINMTETSPGMFCTDICPEATTTINGQINLERQRK